jgi:soluble lytic murein transglycosylase
MKIAKAVALGVSILISGMARADEATALRDALRAAGTGDWAAALTAAQGAGAVGGEVILWQWLRDGQGKLGDYEGFLARRPDWPGLALLKEKGEVAVARSTDPARVLAYFGADKPKTGKGAVALVSALLAGGLEMSETLVKVGTLLTRAVVCSVITLVRPVAGLTSGVTKSCVRATSSLLP